VWLASVLWHAAEHNEQQAVTKSSAFGYGPPAERLPLAVGIATGSCDADILEKILGAE
jgi:hypothetical protein